MRTCVMCMMCVCVCVSLGVELTEVMRTIAPDYFTYTLLKGSVRRLTIVLALITRVCVCMCVRWDAHWMPVCGVVHYATLLYYHTPYPTALHHTTTHHAAFSDSWATCKANLMHLRSCLEQYYASALGRPFSLDHIDVEALARDKDVNELAKMVEFVVGAAVQCENKDDYIGE